MKSVLFSIGILLSVNMAHAAPVDWQDQLAQFKQDLTQDSTAHVWLDYFLYAGTSAVTCSADMALTAAVFVADTTPVVNGAVQIVASYPNFDQDLANLFTWDALANIGRGAGAGGVVAVTDTLQFIYLWLGGDTSQSYQQLEKTYASTITTAETLFANQGECMMSMAKTLLASTELQTRNADMPTPTNFPAPASLTLR